MRSAVSPGSDKKQSTGTVYMYISVQSQYHYYMCNDKDRDL